MTFKLTRNEFLEVFPHGAILNHDDINYNNNKSINKKDDLDESTDLKQYYTMMLTNWIIQCKKEYDQKMEFVNNFDENLLRDSIIIFSNGNESEEVEDFTKFYNVLSDLIISVLKLDFFSEKWCDKNRLFSSYNTDMPTDLNGVSIDKDFQIEVMMTHDTRMNSVINVPYTLSLLKSIIDIKQEYLEFSSLVLSNYKKLITHLMILKEQQQDTDLSFPVINNFINSLFMNAILENNEIRELFISNLKFLIFHYFKIVRNINEFENASHAISEYENSSFIEILGLLDDLGMKHLLKNILMDIFKFHCKKFLLENFNDNNGNDNSNQLFMNFISANYNSFQLLYRLFSAQKQNENIHSDNKDIIIRFFLKQLNDQLLNLNILNLFQIIERFPISQFSKVSILQIQKRFLRKKDDLLIYQRKVLINNFIANLKSKLLNPGVETLKILKYYILMIKSFNLLEPNGVLLDIVSRPIRKYLKDRNDTISHIVLGLLEEEQENEDNLHLTTYLINYDKEFDNDDYYERQHVNFDNHNYSLNWTPAPIDALPDFQQQEKPQQKERAKPFNIIECLITLFDSKKVFINEFLNKFSRKLINLRNDGKEIDSLIFKIKLLKKIFIKNNINDLNNLDIMINDILQSKKYNAFNDNNKSSSSIDFKNTVVSYLFWPKDLINININNDEEHRFQLPQQFQDQYDSFAKNFQIRNPGRIVEPIYSLGKVEVRLELKDRIKTFTVTPDLASIIYLFNDDDEVSTFALTLHDISEKLSFKNLNQLKNRIQYWINNGILKEIKSETYQVLEIEQNDSSSAVINSSNFESEDNNCNGNSGHNNNELNDKMEKYLPFIIAMLTNLGTMDLSKMKNLLSFTIPQELNFNCNDSELQDYLNYLVEEEKLEFIGGKSYKLKK